MRANEFIAEGWSQKYKKSINCGHPKGFSQRAHCAGKTEAASIYRKYINANKKTESLDLKTLNDLCLPEK